MKKLLKNLFSRSGKKSRAKKLATEIQDIHPRESIVNHMLEANENYMWALMGLTNPHKDNH